MKQNITAVIICALILTGSYFSMHYTKNISEKILKTLSACEEEVVHENWDEALSRMTISHGLWRKYRPRLALFLPHRNLDEISDLIVKVTSLIHQHEKNAFITENKRLAALVKDIGKSDTLTFANLF